MPESAEEFLYFVQVPFSMFQVRKLGGRDYLGNQDLGELKVETKPSRYLTLFSFKILLCIVASGTEYFFSLGSW